jgi:hypothetical protein
MGSGVTPRAFLNRAPEIQSASNWRSAATAGRRVLATRPNGGGSDNNDSKIAL